MNAKPKRSNPHGWKANDVRDICPCQAHARRERSLWRRSLRAVRARGVALIVGLPLAFGALEFPIEAMNMSFPSALKIERAAVDTPTAVRASQTPAMFPIFTTRRVREQFLNPEGYAQNFTLEVAREHFFRTHVPYGPIIYREAKRHNLPP